MINRYRLIFLFFIIFNISGHSQISEGGLPPSFKFTSLLRYQSISELNVPINIDFDKLKSEDQVAERNGSLQRIARSIPVSLDLGTTGGWITLPDSVKIWRQSVTLTDALGLIISYNDFFIPKGGQLFIYNADKSQVLGAYTYDTHPEGGKFATEIISGDSFTLEYVASQISTDQPRISISNVGYIYTRNSLLSGILPNINDESENCSVNVNCPLGANWQNQKRGVVLYFVQSYEDWYPCSGTLINNTNQDGTPYILSAWHCFMGDPHLNSLITYFNFEFSTCENESTMPAFQTLVGVTPLVQIPLENGSDQFLIKLKNSIPEDYTPFFNGWDRRNIAPESGVVIHHPNGSVKRIIGYDKPATSSKYVGDKASLIGADNAHWKVSYNGDGATQVGSSGSPLFNQDGLVVGTLTGGFSSCEDLLEPDYYGKFSYGWDQNAQTNLIPYDQQLKTYLDPLDKGVEVLKGYDPYGTSGISDEEYGADSPKELVIFPNPTEDELNINVNSIIRKISIYNLQGRLVFTQDGYNASTAVIPVSTLTKGIYTISIKTENKKLSDKFFKK